VTRLQSEEAVVDDFSMTTRSQTETEPAQDTVLLNIDRTYVNVHDLAVTVQWEADLGGNVRRVAETLRVFGPRTRAELVTLTGLSRPTVAAALTDLNDLGLVSEQHGAVPKPVGGRPASVLRLTRRAGVVVGVDVGRRHVRVVVADLSHAVLAERAQRTDFDADDRPGDSLELATRLTDATLADVDASRANVVAVGLGIPAPITPDGRISSPDLCPGWAALHPGPALEARLGTPVHAENDANLGVLSESIWGAGRGCADLVYLKLGTGVGAGLMIDGKLHRGSAGTAGEVGHVTVDARGAVCRCGNRGCLELAAGGRALLAHARIAHPALHDLAELIELAEQGDAGCRRLITDAGTQLGYALGSLVNLINPQRIVLGGALSAAEPLLRDPLLRGLAETAMAVSVDAVEVVRGEFADRATALGGVAMALGVNAVA
jgi:predicted NBD/HSP70 family sugar kinase